MADHFHSHTQRGWIQWILAPIGLIQVGSGLAMASQALPLVRGLLIGVGGLLTLLSLCFAQLTVQGGGERLRIAFGPLPIFRRSIPYARIRSFERGRSSLIDGPGIHWVPFRGWTWNIHGRDCLELDLEGGRVRVGTDDPVGLARHREARTS